MQRCDLVALACKDRPLALLDVLHPIRAAVKLHIITAVHHKSPTPQNVADHPVLDAMRCSIRTHLQ